MRVAMYYSNSDVRLEEMPKPQTGADELLFKVMACGICGSDVMEWYRIKKAPLVLGHEAAGEVAEVGGNVKNYRVGDRVFITHHVPCNTCGHCLKGHHTACETLHKTNFFPGGFSEFVRVPAINVDRGVYRLPDSMTYDDATFIEPLACVVRGQRLAGIESGDSVMVIGSGVAGLLHIKLARASGAGRIIASDINGYRLAAARKFGADAVINSGSDVASEVKKANDGRLCDKVIVCAGALPAARQALGCVDSGGKVLFFAVPKPGEDVPVPMNEMWRNEVTLLTSYGAAPIDLQAALDLISSGAVKVSDMITHRFGLADAGKGFRLFSGGGDCLKVIIEPQK
jgi:L-iditol 2-dehydrogenase